MEMLGIIENEYHPENYGKRIDIHGIRSAANGGRQMTTAQGSTRSQRISPAQLESGPTPHPGGQRIRLPAAFGDCRTERLSLDDGLALVSTRYLPNRPLVEESINPHPEPMLVITFGLRGRSGYLGRDGSALAFDAGRTTVSRFHGGSGERRYDAAQEVSQLRLLADRRLLTRYLGAERVGQLLGDGGVRQLAGSPTAPASTAHVNALALALEQPTGGPLQMHIHALSLLAMQLEALATPPPSPTARLSQADIERLHQTRELMQAQLGQPLTVAYLCAAVGLNAFKLKQGFHHCFATTPHRLLLEMRMHKAHLLLESGCQVAQAAWQVGYRHPNNFSAAFTAFFGKSPKTVFGKRRPD